VRTIILLILIAVVAAALVPSPFGWIIAAICLAVALMRLA
jgi:hypothetical protein